MDSNNKSNQDSAHLDVVGHAVPDVGELLVRGGRRHRPRPRDRRAREQGPFLMTPGDRKGVRPAG